MITEATRRIAIISAVVMAISGCAPQAAKPVRPDEIVDISAIEGQWSGRSERWGQKNTLRIYNDDAGRAMAFYCWHGWCRNTRSHPITRSKITPTGVEFLLGRTPVVYQLEGDVLKGTFDPAGTQWDHAIELRRDGN